MTQKLENEVAILDNYNDELEKLGQQLSEADAQSSKQIQKEFDRKLDIYNKQIQLVQQDFPDADDGKLHEAAFYTFQASRKVFGSVFMRRVAQRSSKSAMVIASAVIAKQQEKNAAREALTLLDKALTIFDYPGARFMKAAIFADLKQKEQALAELNYIISNFQDDKVYISARQMKDEIENPPKKGMCFVATAAYGSPLAPEVIIFRKFRDENLLTSELGSTFVAIYYRISPFFANLIARHELLKTVTRKFLLEPILRKIKK